MKTPKVLIDTNVLKFSATGPLMFIPVNRKTTNLYGRVVAVQASEIGYQNRNEKIEGSDLKKEVDLLLQISELAKSGGVQIFLNRETMFESTGLPAMESPSGKFFGAPINDAAAPIRYARTLMSPAISSNELTLNFLKGIKDTRFLELQKVTGAYQGKDKFNLNQLLDAFYIWCAEHNHCDYMLTLDFKLIKMARNNPKHSMKVKVVKPSELLAATENFGSEV